MVKKWFIVLTLTLFSVSMVGCASMRKNNDLEIQSLKNQISVLEAQIQNKDEEISGLKNELCKNSTQATSTETKVTSIKKSKKRIIGEVKHRPSIKQIQIALTNAGYDPGSTDGKIGKQTKDAIKAFQAANNLPIDGHVGGKTWELLKEHLYNKVK